MNSYIKRALGRQARRLSGMVLGTQQSLIDKAARFVACEMVEGDYVEFGVYQGGSFVAAYHALRNAFAKRIKHAGDNSRDPQSQERQRIWDNMRFIGFDSFEGLPELKGIDTDTKDFKKGQYAFGLDAFRKRISQDGVPLSSTVLIPGWFCDTCTEETRKKHQIDKAAVIWIDGDLYESAVDALKFCTPLLQDGTVIIFDDWYAFRGSPYRGEQRAFAEWTANLSEFTVREYQKEGVWRNSFIVSKVE